MKISKEFADLAADVRKRCESVYAAMNQCAMTGLERPVRRYTFPDGTDVRLYQDHKGKYRIVAFKSTAHSVGYSGILLEPDGEVHYKETCPAMRGKNSTRMLQGVLTSWKIHWYPSPYQTKAGAACYA